MAIKEHLQLLTMLIPTLLLLVAVVVLLAFPTRSAETALPGAALAAVAVEAEAGVAVVDIVIGDNAGPFGIGQDLLPGKPY